MEDKDKITYFAETDHRNRIPFGIKAEDRARHVYTIGKTGMGKSTLLENMAIQDIQNGNGVCFVDPHGKTADFLLDFVPKHRIKDVIYFAPFDMENPLSFNIMEDVGYDKRHLVANGLMSAFKKIWVDAWSARMEYILSNVIMALLEYPDSTLLGVNRMLVDKAYRKKVVDNIKDPSVKSFWVDEFAKYTDRYTQDATPAIQNKVGQFTANPLIRNIIGQPKSSFDLRKVMDEKKILIINLSKGQIGEGNANLLGSMMITKLYLSAMSRADLSGPELDRKPNFYLFVDEFQSFANESFADILSEARKYKLNLTIAHQYIEQMPEEVRSAVFGNVGTMIVFRVGAYDADLLEKEFAPRFYAEDLVNLGFAQTYLKLMIDGVTSQPFSARTLPPVKPADVGSRDEVIASSRELYAAPRKMVEDNINTWYGDTREPTPAKKGEGGEPVKPAKRIISTPEELAVSKKKKLANLKKSKEKKIEPVAKEGSTKSENSNNSEPMVKGTEMSKKETPLNVETPNNSEDVVKGIETPKKETSANEEKSHLQVEAKPLDSKISIEHEVLPVKTSDTSPAEAVRSKVSNQDEKVEAKKSSIFKDGQVSNRRVSDRRTNNRRDAHEDDRRGKNYTKETVSGMTRNQNVASSNSYPDKKKTSSSFVLNDLKKDAIKKDMAENEKEESGNVNGLKDALRDLLKKEVDEKVKENREAKEAKESNVSGSHINTGPASFNTKTHAPFEKTLPRVRYRGDTNTSTLPKPKPSQKKVEVNVNVAPNVDNTFEKQEEVKKEIVSVKDNTQVKLPPENEKKEDTNPFESSTISNIKKEGTPDNVENTTKPEVTERNIPQKKEGGNMFNERSAELNQSKNEVPEGVLKNVLGID